jgi:hypothetical protein
MVILKGYVRDGQASTEYDESMVISSAIIQGSRIVYTSSNGTFYTSADTATNYVTCEAAGYKTVEYSIPVFATTYDPSGVISGSITSINLSSLAGTTVITDTHKLFLSGSLTGRVLTMMDGLDDGKSGEIIANTANIITVGEISDWKYQDWKVCAEPKRWSPYAYHAMLAHSDGSIYLANGYAYTENYMACVWKSTDAGVTWHLISNEPPGYGYSDLVHDVAFYKRYYSSLFEESDGSVVMGFGAWLRDVWKSTDGGVTWKPTPGIDMWDSNWVPRAVMLSDNSIILVNGDHYIDVWKSVDRGATYTVICSGAPYLPRGENQLVVQSGDCIVTTGGFKPTGYVFKNDVWRSVNGGANWTCMTSNAAWTARISHTLNVLSDNTLILIGGENASELFNNEVWKSNDNGATWTSSGVTTFGAISRHATVVLSGDVLLVTGGDSPKRWSRKGWVWKSTDKGLTWAETIITDGLDERSCGGMAATPNGTMMILGGYTEYGSDTKTLVSTDKGSSWTITNVSNPFGWGSYPNLLGMPDNSFVFCQSYATKGIWRTTDNGVNWSCMSSGQSFPARNKFGYNAWVALPDGSIVLAGGESGGYPSTMYNDAWRSTDYGATFSCMTSNAEWSKRSFLLGAALSDDSILLIGGYNGGTYYKDVWRSTDLGSHWSCLTSTTVCPDTYGELVVLSDDSLILAGGKTISYSDDMCITWETLPFLTGKNTNWNYGIAYISGYGVVIQGGDDYNYYGYYGRAWVLSENTSGTAAIINASPGDIYNIGGVSSDPTNHIEFTMWANSAYGSRGQGE